MLNRHNDKNKSLEFSKLLNEHNSYIRNIGENLKEDSTSILLQEVDDSISKQLDIRISLDGKSFTVLGIMIGFLTFILANIYLVYPTHLEKSDACCVGLVLNIIIVTGVSALVISIVILLLIILPKSYKMIDTANFFNPNVDISKVDSQKLKIVLLKRKQEIYDSYVEYNSSKAKYLAIAIVIGSISGIVILITYFIISNLHI